MQYAKKIITVILIVTFSLNNMFALESTSLFIARSKLSEIIPFLYRYNLYVTKTFKFSHLFEVELERDYIRQI